MTRINIPMNERICGSCGGTTTLPDGKGYPNWHNVNGQIWCERCHKRKIRNPKSNAKFNPLNTPRLLSFKNKQFVMKELPRKGKCDNCNKKVGDEYTNCFGQVAKILLTNIHHINYHEDDKLKDTIELCVSCHIKESWRLGVYKNKLESSGGSRIENKRRD